LSRFCLMFALTAIFCCCTRLYRYVLLLCLCIMYFPSHPLFAFLPHVCAQRHHSLLYGALPLNFVAVSLYYVLSLAPTFCVSSSRLRSPPAFVAVTGSTARFCCCVYVLC